MPSNGSVDRDAHGRDATSPARIPAKGWWSVIKRVVSEVSADRIMLTAAGVTFYLLLALFPALTAFVSIYGFVSDPATVAQHLTLLDGVLPSGGVELIETQLQSLARQDPSALSFGFVFGLLVALWSANSGMKSIFDAMNVVYEEDEKRGFIKYNLMSLGFTLAALVAAMFFIALIGIVPAVLAFLYLEGMTEFLIRFSRWPLMLFAVAFAFSVIYRWGPSRRKAKWRWVSWGSGFAAIAWLLVSIGFSWYLENFANYNATYGSLGAVIGFMIWTWISVIILLVGAELNAELEHQTAVDTTRGPDRPMGERGAEVADSVAAES
ncbi:YihY/virulence factor BrkB family protein [Aquamicrobium sp. cd-1]|uniref:YihY/virulence factor BrkB family protein n=2 Tax=Aquamicrobium zhengzhouense TaxID=2781738 RepID=A0ABS0SC77_9HYPH|nr:YihY/virulence factor BrkB family protein [Aquamicrobium zhengzhouense]